jgi:hypothetical protein
MHRSLIAVALLMLAPLATAQVYKWTDAHGTVHYSEAPPATGTNYKQMKTNGTAPTTTAPAASAANAENAPAAAAAPATAPANPVVDTPEKLCASLKANLATLQGSAPVVMQQNGKTTALDDTQRKQQINSTQAQYQQFCQAR